MDETSHNQQRRGRGRPRSETAESHTAILEAVYELLQERSVRDLTMEAVARQAGVGKPTLYKWWPTKAALVMALLQERLASAPAPPAADTAEGAIRSSVRLLIGLFNGPFGRIMADLIAEGQSEPALLRELYERHISERRAETVAEVERGKAAGEFAADTDPELLVDAIFGAIYYRLLLRSAPLTGAFGEQIVDQVLRGVRPGGI
ncbi:MAG TPA: TetR/AcrR family transcriptional regulator [Roseiflexaceae bacterium]|nr:TetR/AcrR family transcriptional regulator [Roseiflexaceae bacterium]